MKIAIIGAGAMGCLYGGKLSALPENEVYLLDVWKDHVDAVNASGLAMETDGELAVYDHIKAVTDADAAGICDLAIIFVKSTRTKEAVTANRAVFGPETIALTLQNGLGNIEQISEVIGSANVLAGTTAHGATMLGPGKMRHAGKGKTIIGELDGQASRRAVEIVDMMNRAELLAELSDNVLGLVWDKLLVNVGINALTGLTRLHNGQLLDYPEIVRTMEAAVSEGATVAAAKGIKLSFPDPVTHTKDVCIATAKNRASMLQDVENQRETEIEMLNGAIVREGVSEGIATPVNQVLTDLIRFVQRYTESK